MLRIPNDPSPIFGRFYILQITAAPEHAIGQQIKIRVHRRSSAAILVLRRHRPKPLRIIISRR
jgi:hypothetical protein